MLLMCVGQIVKLNIVCIILFVLLIPVAYNECKSLRKRHHIRMIEMYYLVNILNPL